MIILRQKAYGKVGRFIDKISGGRISKALEKSIEKDRALRDKAKSDFIFGDKVVNPEIEKKLANEASKRGIKIVNTKSSGISMNEVIKSSDNNSN